MRLLVLGLMAALVASCGFRPMYAASPDAPGGIGPVSVGQIDGKAGYILRAELVRMLAAERGEGPPRRLEILLSEQINRLGIRVDESAQRADLVVTARYTLESSNAGPPLTGRVSTTVSFDIPLSAFGEVAAQDDARERAGETLARQLRTELALRIAAGQ